MPASWARCSGPAEPRRRWGRRGWRPARWRRPRRGSGSAAWRRRRRVPARRRCAELFGGVLDAALHRDVELVADHALDEGDFEAFARQRASGGGALGGRAFGAGRCRCPPERCPSAAGSVVSVLAAATLAAATIPDVPSDGHRDDGAPPPPRCRAVLGWSWVPPCWWLVMGGHRWSAEFLMRRRMGRPPAAARRLYWSNHTVRDEDEADDDPLPVRPARRG